jgi:hypothetical protein
MSLNDDQILEFLEGFDLEFDDDDDDDDPTYILPNILSESSDSESEEIGELETDCQIPKTEQVSVDNSKTKIMIHQFSKE